MKVERSIRVPLRSARQTTDDLANFIGEVLTARSFPAAGQVNAQLKRLSPLLSMLLAKRIVGTPALCLHTDDMEVRVNVDYEVDATDNLSIPTMTLLGDLDPDATINVTLYATEEVAPGLRTLVTTASGAPASLDLVVTGSPDSAMQQVEEAEQSQDAPEKQEVDETREAAGGITDDRLDADPAPTIPQGSPTK